MIHKEIQRLISHYERRPVIMFLRYLKDGKQYHVFNDANTLEIGSNPTAHRVENVLEGTQYIVFDIGTWRGGEFKLFVVGRGGYMPKEDMPNG